MSFVGNRRFVCSSLVVLLIISVLQIWVCCDSCQAGAIRIFPGNVKETSNQLQGRRRNMDNKEKLFRKYFKGTSFALNNTTHHTGFQDTKRKVPSCPDPLHN